MGSTRFPGKSLVPIWGRMSLLEVVLRRAMRAATLDFVVLATSDQAADDALIPVARDLDIPVFRGDEQDVLQRFCGAIEQFPADAVVRICGDNPLVDPAEIDKLVDFFWASQPCDYACNDRLDCGLPDGVGVEVVSASALRRLDKAVDGELREHVTMYAYLHRDEFSVSRLVATGPLRRPDVRLDVDYPHDADFIRALMQAMGPENAPYWTTLQAIDAFDRNPQLTEPRREPAAGGTPGRAF